MAALKELSELYVDREVRSELADAFLDFIKSPGQIVCFKSDTTPRAGEVRVRVDISERFREFIVTARASQRN